MNYSFNFEYILLFLLYMNKDIIRIIIDIITNTIIVLIFEFFVLSFSFINFTTHISFILKGELKLIKYLIIKIIYYDDISLNSFTNLLNGNFAILSSHLIIKSSKSIFL